MKNPLPRINKKLKMVCLYHSILKMFEVFTITDKGLVSRAIAPQSHFTDDVQEAFRHFQDVPFAGFKSVKGVDVTKYRTWNEYAEGVWTEANKK